MSRLDSFFKKYNIKPKNVELYEMAFTHSSYNWDAKTSHHDYERLEFVGDSVVGFVVGTKLFRTHKDMREGDLTKSRSFLVQTDYLAKLALREGFDQYILTGKSMTQQELSNHKSILEDVFEAVMGAIYLDQGIEFVRKLIERIYGDEIENFVLTELKDYKSMLQEAMQAEYRESVEYILIDEKGPPHDKTFTVEVRFNGLILGHGTGKSKKAAEQMAAQDALDKKATL
ncbi:MAG: ribonuclease III [Bacilli bacterium]|nr:ribonuclease III [Bacilli bacterium]